MPPLCKHGAPPPHPWPRLRDGRGSAVEDRGHPLPPSPNGLAAPESTRQGPALRVASPDLDGWAQAPPRASLPTRGDDHSEPELVVWDKPSRLPDQLPDNAPAEGCARPDSP